MKSIKSKILTLTLTILSISILAISANAIIATYNSTMFALEESMEATINVTANKIEVQLKDYTNLVSQLAINPIITQEIPKEGELSLDGRTRAQVRSDMNEYFEEIKDTHSFIESVQVFEENGDTVFLELNEVNAPYFTIPRDTGEVYITDPILSPDTGMLTMVITTPIIKDGEFSGVVLFAVNPQIFSELVSEVEVGVGSTTTIIAQSGDTIAYNDVSYVQAAYNTNEEAKTDSSLKAMADVETRLINGESGFEEVVWDGKNQFVAFTPIESSNGWGIYTLTPQSNFLAQLTTSVIVTVIMAIVIIIISAIFIIGAAKGIISPITLCADRLDKLASGDLKSPVPIVTSKDETGKLANSTAAIVESLSMIINDLNYTLSEVAAGNFAVSSKNSSGYIGDYASIKVSVDTIIDKLSETMYKINDVSRQVNSGNNQVAEGAQALAQGSVEQAAAIEELSITIDNIAQNIGETANDSQNAKLANEKSQSALDKSNVQINEMVLAMENISKKSVEISKIIKAIDDIAFQTNILALNAAVEAARAGTAGKGFAVVADEVRSLATKSAQSAKDITLLIEETVGAVNVGNDIATGTSETINVAIKSAYELSALVDSIAESSMIQSEGAKQITIGIEQISAVIQNNSATAEESAATSEELSGQSQILDQLVSEFVLKNDRNNNYTY